jgi:acyl carrier protein
LSLQVQETNKTVSFETFCEAISEHLKVNPEKLSPQALWVKDVGISSVDIVKIVMLIRQKFGVKILTSQAGKIKTVQDAYELVNKG